MADARHSRSALFELTANRFREITREPEAVFWTFVFPIILALGLGIAFRSKPVETVRAGVVEEAGAPQLIASIQGREGLELQEFPSLDGAQAAMRAGKIAIVIVPGDPGHVDYFYDDTRPDSRLARLVIDDAVQRGAGREDPATSADSLVREPGSRYIDFVIPGLIGMNIMGSTVWSLGYTIVDARRRRLLKRLVATPMSRAQYLMSFLVSRLLLLVAEVAVIIGFATLAFDVPFRGGILPFATVIIVATFAFGGLGLLMASRARTIEGASGLMNAAMMPMWVLSGVFFSAEHFPAVVQPFIQALPLTAANDALRATMLRADGWSVIAPDIAIMAVWAIVSGFIALKIFRWR